MSEHTIPPWTRLPCDNCGADHLGSRGNSVTAERFICEECEIWERADKNVEARIEAAFRAGAEAMRRALEAKCDVLRPWAPRKATFSEAVTPVDALWSDYKKGGE